METIQLSIHMVQDTEDKGGMPGKLRRGFLNELPWYLPNGADTYVRETPDNSALGSLLYFPLGIGGQGGGGFLITDVLVQLLNQTPVVIGAVTGLVLAFAKLLERDKDCEITIKYGDRELTIKGQRVPNPEVIIGQLFPELDTASVEPLPSRLDEARARLEARVSEPPQKG